MSAEQRMKAAQCHRCPVKEASGYPLAHRTLPCQSSPLHDSSACAEHIHCTSARTLPHQRPYQTSGIADAAGASPHLPSSSRPTRAISDGGWGTGATTPLSITAHRKRQHSRRIAPLPHTLSVLRKWRVHQRSAAEGGGQWGSGRLEGPMPQSAEGGKRGERGGVV
jgi:hypothetical protein